MKSKKNKVKRGETNLPLSNSKKKTPQSLKPESKIVKFSNEKSKLGESNSKPSTSKKKIPKSSRPETGIVKKSFNENSKSADTKEMQNSQNLVKKPSNENTKRVNTKEKLKSENLEPKIAKKGLHEKSGQVKEEKSASTVQPRNESRKKLGGVIFMCNARTKPDCYRYRVMGVQAHKKELVMGVKPGMKLFLFDFDLKLLYGIYKASSTSGMKLEPAAFGGGFPLQVRFEVEKDCIPLPESLFKKAIKENYDEKTRKFKTELTIGQVYKLTNLFKPAPTLLPEPQLFVHEPRGPSEHEIQHLPKQPLSSPPLLLTEQEYRSYGLRGERQNDLNALGPAYDPYRYGQEREAAPPDMLFPSEKDYRTYDPYRIGHEREAARPDMRFLSEKDYRTYGLKGAHENPISMNPNIDPTPAFGYQQSGAYNSYDQSTSSLVGRYLSLPMADDFGNPPASSGPHGYVTTHVENERRYHPESILPERANVSNAFSEYNQKYPQGGGGGEPEYRSASVSSRYAFAGPSVIYR